MNIRHENRKSPHYSTERVRGGGIALHLTVQRAIFIIGLVAAVIFAVIAGGRPHQ